MTLKRTLSPDLMELLAAYDVQVHEPHETMVELKAVPAGPDFSKPRTNLLLRQRSGWDVFVDEDFAYVGSDSRRQPLFSGNCRNRWQALALRRPVRGDLNEAVLYALDVLDSPLCAQYRDRGGTNQSRPVPRPAPPPTNDRELLGEPAEPLDDDRYSRLLDVQEFDPDATPPTSGQAGAVNLVFQTLLRSTLPACPVVCGPSGVGKSLVARLSAGQLKKRGIIKTVFEVNGAALAAADACLPGEREQRLREALELARRADSPLVILEQFDLLVRRSNVAPGLVSHYLDVGLRMIGVARPQFGPARVHPAAALRRRLQFVELKEPAPAETMALLLYKMERFEPARRIEIARQALESILALSSRCAGANPAAALGLLESVLVYADGGNLSLVGPDEVYHVQSLNEWGAWDESED